MISKGFLDQAARHAQLNVERLYEHARRGAFIVGCEPSCLLAIREEYVDLLRGEDWKEKARLVARQSLLLDEFLGRMVAEGKVELPPHAGLDGGCPVLFHAHCQQRAAADPSQSLRLLERAGYRPELTDARCCGMAGGFGYEREHYERSRAAAERMLLPAVREAPDAELAVMGISCRQQIQGLSGRPVRHVAELLRDALVPTCGLPGV
jgi:Fe-S oxidoreductase